MPNIGLVSSLPATPISKYLWLYLWLFSSKSWQLWQIIIFLKHRIGLKSSCNTGRAWQGCLCCSLQGTNVSFLYLYLYFYLYFYFYMYLHLYLNLYLYFKWYQYSLNSKQGGSTAGSDEHKALYFLHWKAFQAADADRWKWNKQIQTIQIQTNIIH